MSYTTRTLAVALVGAVSVAAHGDVPNIVINGLSYPGYDTTTMPYMADPPAVVGWATTATDLGFVGPDSYADPDIICHRDATNALGHAQVAAGDSIYIQWTAWPESHHGPVLDYLAPCGDSGCETVDKTTLEFFKIDEVGLVDGSAAPGQYGDDLLIANNNGWMVEIPSNIAPGFYVLRHEIIALHSAGTENGAQNYPQCFNLEVTGSGTDVPDGVLGTELYKADDAGILFNIYTTLSTYPVPGPTVIDGASAVDQATSAIASSGTVTTGTALATGGAATDAPATTAVADATTAVDATTAAATTAAATTEAAATTAPAVTTEITPTTPADTVVPTATSTGSAAEPTSPGTCKAKRSKRSKKSKSNKFRRHARDVGTWNVAPM